MDLLTLTETFHLPALGPKLYLPTNPDAGYHPQFVFASLELDFTTTTTATSTITTTTATTTTTTTTATIAITTTTTNNNNNNNNNNTTTTNTTTFLNDRKQRVVLNGQHIKMGKY